MKKFLSQTNKKIRRYLKKRHSQGMSNEQLEELIGQWYFDNTQKTFGQAVRMDFRNPRTFNEKLQWLKIYEQSDLRTQLSDKYLAKQLAADMIGPEYIVPLYGVWDRYSDINFDRLPDQFVLKANHGNKWQMQVRDKKAIDHKKARENFDRWLIENYAYKGFELQYRDIKPRIIAEKFLVDGDNPYVYDYRVWCFNGRPEIFLVTVVDETGDLTCSYFDLDYKHLPSLHVVPEVMNIPEKPVSFDLMLDLSRKLSEKFSFARVDFYQIDGRPYFGELTFLPNRGLTPWRDLKNDLYYGNMLKLPLRT